MESVKKANARFRTYPQILAKCAESAGSYAKCVTQKESVQRNECLKEFQKFRGCLMNAAKGMKTRL